MNNDFFDDETNEELNNGEDTGFFTSMGVQDNSDMFDDDIAKWTKKESDDISKENVVNQKNEEEFQEIMSNASKKYNTYWDRDDLVIKIIMIGLFGFAAIGVAFYLFLWFFAD